MRLLPQKEAVRVDIAPFDQETKPLAKIRCVNMEDDAYQPSELKGQLRVLEATYRISELFRAQRNDRKTRSLKRLIENGAPNKRDLREGSYRILRKCYIQKDARLYVNNDVIFAGKMR